MQRFPGQVRMVLTLALVWMATGGCRSARLSAPTNLRIGVVPDAPPLIFRQNGRWAGVEADFARALAARLEMKPVFVACPPGELSSALLNGQVDILMAALPVTEERRLQMDFSQPYLVGGQAALIRAEDILRYNTDLKIRSARSRIGVRAESTAQELVAGYFTPATVQEFARPEEAAAALRDREIDLFIQDGPGAWWLARQSDGRLVVAPPLFARKELAWGFRRSSVALREAANRALDEWQQDGTLEATLRRWLPVSK